MGRAKFSVNKSRKKKTEVTQPLPGNQGLRQVLNSAGGYVFSEDSWQLLRRFLILGTETGTFYISKRELDLEHLDNLAMCLQEDYKRTVDLAVEVSLKGQAPKDDPAIFVLAAAAASDNLETRAYARTKIKAICRIPTALFTFLAYYDILGGGWSSGFRKAIGDWYNSKNPDKLAYHLAKYQSREGWSNRDVLRLCHLKPASVKHNAAYRWAVAGPKDMLEREVQPGRYHTDLRTRRYPGFVSENIPHILHVYEAAKKRDLTSPKDRITLASYVRDHGLTHEMLPTEAKKYPEIWEALAEKMPLTALIRNLGNISKAGLTQPGSGLVFPICEKIIDAEYLKKARIHPLTLLKALRTYASGSGLRGSASWETNHNIIEALDEAFYKAFEYAEPTGKVLFHSVDVSGSMWGSRIESGLMSAHEGAAVMMMTSLKADPEAYVTVFDDYCRTLPGMRPSLPLDIVIQKFRQAGSGGTDISSTLVYALGSECRETRSPSPSWHSHMPKRREGSPIKVDAFILYTDNETWHGGHPQQYFEDYLKKVNPHTKLIVISMVPNYYTTVDIEHPSVLSLVGFDTSVPKLISGFLGGE